MAVTGRCLVREEIRSDERKVVGSDTSEVGDGNTAGKTIPLAQPALMASVVLADDLGYVLERSVIGVEEEISGRKRPRRRFMIRTGTFPASSSSGVHRCSVSRVVRLMLTMGRTAPPGCPRPRVVPKSSQLASQHKRKWQSCRRQHPSPGIPRSAGWRGCGGVVER